MDKTPSNADLAQEASKTTDCERQVELAEHPSLVVRRALARNAKLCTNAAEVLGDELDHLRKGTGAQINEVLPEE